MNTFRVFRLLLCVALLMGAPLRAESDEIDLTLVPASLVVPGGRAPDLVLTAKGVQIYECRAVAGEAGRYEWVFKAPEADLFDGGDKAGHHYAGPTWESTDGSKVVGRVKAKADAPDGKGVPWLLLEGVEHHGSGRMANVQYIQRVGTAGGQAPVEPADATKAGQLHRVDYTATYLFYVAKP